MKTREGRMKARAESTEAWLVLLNTAAEATELFLLHTRSVPPEMHEVMFRLSSAVASVRER